MHLHCTKQLNELRYSLSGDNWRLKEKLDGDSDPPREGGEWRKIWHTVKDTNTAAQIRCGLHQITKVGFLFQIKYYSKKQMGGELTKSIM